MSRNCAERKTTDPFHIDWTDAGSALKHPMLFFGAALLIVNFCFAWVISQNKTDVSSTVLTWAMIGLSIGIIVGAAGLSIFFLVRMVMQHEERFAAVMRHEVTKALNDHTKAFTDDLITRIDAAGKSDDIADAVEQGIEDISDCFADKVVHSVVTGLRSNYSDSS
jgi:hypothetical protein